MKAIQLDLFTSVPIAYDGGSSIKPEGLFAQSSDSLVSALPANPCEGCEFLGLCSDTCAMSSSLLDPISPTRFRNLNVYISLLKHNGWL